VCAADEVWRLQRGSEADCVFFQRAVNGGKRITDRGTRQGFWVLAPDGTLLGGVNSRSAEAVHGLLTGALERWEQLPESARHLPAEARIEPEHRWEDSWPEDGLVLVRHARELGPEGLAGPRPPAWNRDFAWFSGAEKEALVPADAAPGATLDWSPVARRLARFHLVDNVRGQTLPFADSEVESARLEARIASRVGDQLVLALEGQTSAASAGPWLLGDNLWKPNSELPHGLETRLVGRAVFDRARRVFTSFELVAVARRYGRTENNGRWREAAPGRLAFQLELAPPQPRIAPTFVAVYDADWIVAPPIGTWNQAPEECGLEQD